ncbi:terminase large subunit [Leeia sp. TBRC 13508]|uniref:Terminase large subunit n=1 Tax=Leeia speluncae TaxID=2884804 RepID=A0ABS8D7U0_9NEIS|nr:terminase TerL endonuclease subunit [Leeia speluncae]MCB6184276.1 terminase large subunit [Leeia speluncae]
MRTEQGDSKGADRESRLGGNSGFCSDAAGLSGLVPAGYVKQPWDEYGFAVMAGEVLVCRYTRLAVKRHYDDLLAAGSKGLVWRPDLADHVIKFFGFCRHSKGAGFAGEPIRLEGWQKFWIAVCFGWYRIDGGRRFRTWYEEVARKNGKSTKLAGIGLYLFAMDKEPGAEVYTAATKLEQAKITHSEAEMMVRQSPQLRALISNQKNKLFIQGTSNKYVPLGADAQTSDGLNVHGAIVDELHAHPNRDLWDVLDTARGARKCSLMYAITTAGFNQGESICLEQRNYLISILEGHEVDDSFGGVIYTLDAEDDWRDERMWPKANPNFGISVFADDLRNACRKAIAIPAALANFLTKRLNLWTQSNETWLSLDHWDAGASQSFDENFLKGKRCYGGLDLASTTDLTAWVMIFPPQDGDPNWYVLPRFFVPEENIQLRARKDRVPYLAWRDQGFLIATPGAMVDQDMIRDQVIDDAAKFDIVEVGYDEWNAAKISVELTEAGLMMVKLPQNFGNLSTPTKKLEGLVLEKKIQHNGHPVLRWNAGNVTLLRDTNDNYRPNKKKSRERIDGVVATIMAINRAEMSVAPAQSVYEMGVGI